MSPLILASTSPYRAELLQRLRIPFEQIDPKVRETPEDDESAEKLAPRLARAKAEAVSRHHAGVWSLGSDQVAACLGRVLGKPGDRAVITGVYRAVPMRVNPRMRSVKTVFRTCTPLSPPLSTSMRTKKN